jgi:membrane-associated phospholipid phosphatase
MERSDELSRRLCYLAAMFATAMAVAWTVDVPVASYFRLERQPEFFHELVSFAEVFGHGVGVAYILLAAYVLDVHQRRRLPRIVAAIVGAGLSADLVKLAVGRIRPRAMALDQVWDSFVGWFPKFHPEIRLGLSVNDCQSIPSGHAAVATALAIGLSLLYPRGRWLFACFAVLAWLQRIETCAHYVSDTLAGAALACLVWAAFFDRRGLGRWFDRWEAKQAEANVAVSSLGRYDTETGVEERIDRGSCP